MHTHIAHLQISTLRTFFFFFISRYIRLDFSPFYFYSRCFSLWNKNIFSLMLFCMAFNLRWTVHHINLKKIKKMQKITENMRREEMHMVLYSQNRLFLHSTLTLGYSITHANHVVFLSVRFVWWALDVNKTFTDSLNGYHQILGFWDFEYFYQLPYFVSIYGMQERIEWVTVWESKWNNSRQKKINIQCNSSR